MNWDMIEGNWKQFKGQVKEKWGKLTDDNLDTIAGKRDQLAGKIQEMYGITKDQAELQVKAFEEIHKDYQPKTPASFSRSFACNFAALAHFSVPAYRRHARPRLPCATVCPDPLTAVKETNQGANHEYRHNSVGRPSPDACRRLTVWQHAPMG
jgi:uncharacterized protein YjbJ (UPF0337 family)